MKIKTGFVLRNICDSFVVIAVGERAAEHKGMIKLNETGAFLWQQLQQDRSKTELVQALTTEYDVDETTALAGIDAFIQTLQEGTLLAK